MRQILVKSHVQTTLFDLQLNFLSSFANPAHNIVRSLKPCNYYTRTTVAINTTHSYIRTFFFHHITSNALRRDPSNCVIFLSYFEHFDRLQCRFSQFHSNFLRRHHLSRLSWLYSTPFKPSTGARGIENAPANVCNKQHTNYNELQ